MNNLPNNIIVLDTETISIDKAFIYDLGYIVAKLDAETQQYKIIERSQEIITQIYDNKPLFETAYYSNKREIYTSLMKGRTAKKNKFGYAMQKLKHIIKEHNITHIFAYNSSFDYRAVQQTADLFKAQNTLKDLVWVDILAVANHYIHQTTHYTTYAGQNGWVNPSGYIKTDAEKTYGFLTNNPDYTEPHTSLQDCEIELFILNSCVARGWNNETEYSKKFVASGSNQVLKITVGEKVYSFNYTKRINKKNGEIVLTK